MNTSTTTPTHKNIKPSERKVPPLIIKKNRLTTENEEPSSPSPNSDNEFRSPIKTAKNKNKTAENIFFTTPNRYEPLINSQTEEILTSTNNSQQHMETEKTQINTNEKIPPVFVINNSDYIKLREDISPLLHNNFTATNKNNKIKINVETVDDFRTITKLFEEKKYEYFTYRLKSEKDISAVIRNLPMSITESEIFNELENLKYPIISVTKLKDKNKLPLPLTAIQLTRTEESNKIFELKRFLNCIISIEPRRKSNAPPQCTNCQRYGHINKSCKLNPRCVKCDGNHHY